MQVLFSDLVTASPVSDDGVLRGVSVITEGESRGWDMVNDSATLAGVLQASAAFKGGLKVKLGHVNDAGAILGVLNNFRIDGNQVKADLSLFREHPSYGIVMRLAKTVPDQIGLSIHFKLTTETINGVQYTRCEELYSCDLVDSPAANPGGLFSAIISQPIMINSTESPAPETAQTEAQLEAGVPMSDTPMSDSQTCLKDVVDQVVKRLDSFEARLVAIEESEQAEDAGSADYSARAAKLEANTSVYLAEASGLKAIVATLQAKLTESTSALHARLDAVEAERKTTAQAASAMLNQLGENIPVATSPLTEPGIPEKLIDFKRLESANGFERIKLARQLESKHGKNWKAEFVTQPLPC